ncbi:MAG: TIGR03557 family F420-dependent LLM class oxidoreductase [Vulcanimicrobiota bacterium]
MIRPGYSLICEEHPPERLLENARKAEEAGFLTISVSDHFHPWISQQGESPFVWNILGALSQVTSQVEIGTAVTCPIMRYHPAVVAQAAATSARMLEGRFHFGVGSGEALNESIVGQHWPETEVRLEMLAEAVEVIRKLWTGRKVSHRGKHYRVENATLFTLPESLPKIVVAASGKKAARLAGQIGDGFWGLAPDRELLQTFETAGGQGKPKYGQFHVCVAKTEEEARRLVHKQWPNGGLAGEINFVLPTPAHFEQACEMVTEEMATENIVCSARAEDHVKMIKKYADAGYTHVNVHQIGHHHQRFFELYQKEVLPEFTRVPVG